MSQSSLRHFSRKFMPVSTGSYAIARYQQTPEAYLYPSKAIAEIAAHIHSLAAIEQAVKEGELLADYNLACIAALAHIADDFEAWALQGYPTKQRLFFSAATLAINPRMLQRAGLGASRYLQQRSEVDAEFNSLYDELLSEYVRICAPGMWRVVDDARTLFTPICHGKAIRSLAAAREDFGYQVLIAHTTKPSLKRISTASAASMLEQLFAWYSGDNRAILAQNLTAPQEWREFLGGQELMPGIEADELWAITSRLIQASDVRHGVDCNRLADRQVLQAAALNLAQWSTWSQRNG